ncbi:amine dehydrogenase large subunit [Thiomicrorhabdus sp.]|uniref:amine dehydrogenase large subunit n=1 Tax=Thiomicrorhabdus sp. TaxID=2039724 RepID=UPI00356AFCE1
MLKNLSPLALGLSAATSLMCLSLTASAETEFKREIFTVEKAIPPGPNVFVNEASWDGASKIHVYGQEDLSYKGELALGLTSQIVSSSDGKQVYALSHYMKRYTYGPVESALQIFDVATLTPIKEIIIPNKAVQAIGMSGLIEKSADDHYVYIQNATPATSVTIVDITKGEVLPELPVPGCYGIFPAEKGNKFSTLCGTGKIKTFTMKNGKYSSADSEKVFDVDNDALYVHAQRAKDGKLIFTSFNGNLYVVDDSGESAKLLETIEVAKGVEGNWAPGGYQVTAYNAPTDTLFMIMHPDAYEGSHKDGSKEIWAYNLKTRKLVSRSPAENLVAISVNQEKTPTVFGSNEEDETVDEFTVTDPEKFVLSKTASDDRASWTTFLTVDK